jgi:hypothetical protein
MTKIKTKWCPGRCGVEPHEVALSGFYKNKQRKDGLQAYCKECQKAWYNANRDTILKSRSEYYHENIDYIHKRSKEYRDAHKEEISAAGAEYYKKNTDTIKQKTRKYKSEHREYYKEYNKCYQEEHAEEIAVRRAKYNIEHRQERIERDARYYEKNREEILKKSYARKKIRLAEDEVYRLVENLRRRVGLALTGKIKSGSTIALIGLSGADLMSYMESLFKPGMTRENYGTYWVVDHIIPCALFDLADVNQQKECFGYHNLQPLTILENSRKKDKIASSLVPWLNMRIEPTCIYLRECK